MELGIRKRIIDQVVKYTQSVLDAEGWGLLLELVHLENDEIFLQIRNIFLPLAETYISDGKYRFDLPIFAELKNKLPDYNHPNPDHYKSAEEFKWNINQIEEFYILTFRKDVLQSLGRLFNVNTNLSKLYAKAQLDNISHIRAVSIKHFYSIKEISLKEIKGAKEVYFLGENGDGKSLVLMGIHLAFNGRFILSKSKKESTGKIIDILEDKKNKKLILNGEDERKLKYGNYKFQYLNNLFAYGPNRSRYNKEDYDVDGFMSLYDNNIELYHPVSFLSELYLAEEHSKLFPDFTTHEPPTLPFNEVIGLLEVMLENNVKIEVSRKGLVQFIEKGYQCEFKQLSEGYKNLIIWIGDLLYRLRKSMPLVQSLKDYVGVVLVDEIELHLHLIWQRRLVGLLRQYLPNLQFILTTHSPTIIQGATEDAIIYRIYRDSQTGETSASKPYFKKDLDHLMLNSLVTSPLFGLEDARVSSNTDNVDTSPDYLESRIRLKVEAAVKSKKEAGDLYLDDTEIDSIIDSVLSEEN